MLGGRAAGQRGLLAEVVSDSEPVGQQLRSNCQRTRKGAPAQSRRAMKGALAAPARELLGSVHSVRSRGAFLGHHAFRRNAGELEFENAEPRRRPAAFCGGLDAGSVGIACAGKVALGHQHVT